jgi:hypothetical protein
MKQKQKTQTQPKSQPAAKKLKVEKPKPGKNPSSQVQTKQMAKFAETNPHLYKLLCEERLIAPAVPKATGTATPTEKNEEDLEIERLEKNLKIKNKKLPTSFSEDGLDCKSKKTKCHGSIILTFFSSLAGCITGVWWGLLQ